MPTLLKVAPGLSLPLSAATETFAFLGKRGSGKTYTAGVLVEELIKAGQQTVVIDPTDAWWGLRSSRDGKGAGLPVVIFGGPHGDLPLIENDSSILARAIVEQQITCVLSLRHLSKSARLRFIAPLLEDMYQLKAERHEPLMLVVDEADRVAPQKLFKGQGQERALGALDEIVRMGRNSGFGCMLITQRSAVISKDVLSQTEVLVCTRTIAPPDIASVDAWISEHDVADKRDEFVATLPSMPNGDSWWWSPGWLDIFKQTRVREKETFDSSRTPRAGERVTQPKKKADVDLDALKKQLSTTIERARADDPKTLHAEIAKLQGELKKAGVQLVHALHSEKPAKIKNATKVQTQAAFTRGANAERRRWKPIIAAATQAAHDLDALGTRLTSDITVSLKAHKALVAKLKECDDMQLDDSDVAAIEHVEQNVNRVRVDDGLEVVSRYPIVDETPRSARRATRDETAGSAGNTPLLEQKIVNILAEIETLGVLEPPRTQVAAFARYHVRTPTFVSALMTLERDGDIEIGTGTLKLTAKGRLRANPQAPIRTVYDLQQRWIQSIEGVGRRILATLLARNTVVSRVELASILEYHVRTPTFVKALTQLLQLGAIAYPQPGMVELTSLVTGR